MRLSSLTPAALCLLSLSGCSTLTTPVSQTSTETDYSLKEAFPPVEVRDIPEVTHDNKMPEPDFWSMLRTDFALPDRKHPRVEKQARAHKKNPHHVEQVLARGVPYIAYIRQEVSKRNLPGEITLLPFIESGFNPFAYSSGHAAGLWQFIPSTGKHFGLKQDSWYDGRRDVIASTDAALDYLEQLNREFKGDWLLTLAAYNAGGGTLRNAIRKNRDSGKATGYWHLDLPAETEKYIPKLLAVSSVIESPSRFRASLPDVDATPVFAEINTGRQLDMTTAAELADMDAEELYALNPGLNRRVMRPDGPHILAIPQDRETLFRERLAQLPASAGVVETVHVIEPGETLSGIAQRFHTSVAILSKVNNIKPNRIRSGQKLVIPGSGGAAQPDLVARRQSDTPEHNRRHTYRVRSGDNLWTIAKRHRVSVGQVANWNRIDSNAPLKPGQQLVIWKGGKTPASTPQPVIHTVRKGDSLYRISKKYSVSVAQLRKWNNLPEGKHLQPGQNLKLYVDASRLSKQKRG